MVDSWQIGEEARKLDNKSIIERLKISKGSIKKIIGAFLIYIVCMCLFYLLL